MLPTLLLLGCLACEGKAPEPPSAPAGRPPPRVVSLSPVASEFVLVLGAGSTLVGVDPESSRLPGLGDLPVVDAAGAPDLAADLVIVRKAPDDAVARRLAAAGSRWIEFAPHDLQDLLVVCRKVAGRVAGDARALQFETELSRPLARLGGESFGDARPRVLAVVSLAPVELAGGHSFETDLIEIAGATSVTHSDEVPRLGVRPEDWTRFSPDLVVVVDRRPRTREEQRRVREALPVDTPIAFFDFDRSRFWLDDPASTARRLRTLIRSHKR